MRVRIDVVATLGLALAASLAACKFELPPEHEVDASPVDGPLVDADVDASPDGMPDAMLDPAMLVTSQQAYDFGDVTLGQTSGVLTFTVRNAGELPAGVAAVTLVGEHPGDFVIVGTGEDDCHGATLGPSETCTAQVRFQPTAPGERAAAVRVAATPGGEAEVPLTGNGLTAGDLVITAGATLDFGTVELQQQTAGQDVTVTNGGQTAIPQLTVMLADPTNYTKLSDSCHLAPLAGGASCTVRVRFNPTALGTLPTSISIRESPQVGVAASATGTGSARVRVDKTGTGTIASIPVGLTCGAGCATATQSFTQTPVTLVATETAGHVFTGWGGACASAGTSTMCSVALNQPLTTASATFTQVFTLTVNVTGMGLVTASPAGIACGNGQTDCTEAYPTGTMVTLSVDPSPGWAVYGWTGAACSQGQTSCVVTMNQARTVGVELRRQYTVSVTTSGSGSGTVTGGGIACPGTCSALVFDGAQVTLSQTPATAGTGSQHVFTGWGGACTGTGGCSFTVDGNKAVSAGFTLQHRVRASLAGSGTGTVAGPSGFSCAAGTCDRYYDHGTAVALTATPGASSLFDAWSGDCTGQVCSGTLDAPRTVTATFLAAHPLTVQVTGTGTVTAPGILCGTGGTDCSELYVASSMVTLTAEPGAGNGVYAWTGTGTACAAGQTMCTVTMSQARTVGVEFRPQYTLSVTASGVGSVTSNVGGINCPGTCAASYFSGTEVVLTATPGSAAPGSRYILSSWGGACMGASSTCTLQLTQNRSASATFQYQHQLTVTVAGTGTGTVTGPSGLSCSTGTCSQYYNAGSNVMLTATPGASTAFDGFSGACSTGTCAMTAPVSTTATFRAWECTPDTLSCSGDNRIQCDADGRVAAETFCPLGCSSSEGTVTCSDVDPSNNLGVYLSMAPGGPNLLFNSAGTPNAPHTVNTDTGTVCNAQGCFDPPSAVAGTVRVFWVSSLNVQGYVRVSGTNALAFVSDGDVVITGAIDVSGNMSVEGPGRSLETTCFGGTFSGPTPRAGGGGGGRVVSGGSGGSAGGNLGGSGGAPIADLTLVPLQGGCRGGRSNGTTPGQVYGRPGGGGGAIQIVSRRSITIEGSGVIDASGGGGGRDLFVLDGTPCCAGGGGSGGAVLLEAPQIALKDSSVISTKGGSGASAGENGSNGGTSAAAAPGGPGTSEYAAGGVGGTHSSTPGHGSSLSGKPGGGGGGSVGRTRANSRTGQYSLTGQSVIRSAQSQGTLSSRPLP